jgi:hypothetical protein
MKLPGISGLRAGAVEHSIVTTFSVKDIGETNNSHYRLNFNLDKSRRKNEVPEKIFEKCKNSKICLKML